MSVFLAVGVTSSLQRRRENPAGPILLPRLPTSLTSTFLLANSCHYDTIKRLSFQVNYPAGLHKMTCFSAEKGGLRKLIEKSCLYRSQLLYSARYSGWLGRRCVVIMKVILDAEQIEQILKDLTAHIISDTPPRLDIAVIGIRSRGEVLAKRLSRRLSQELGKEVPHGTLDITLYRDDLNSPHGDAQPQVRTTEIGFDIDGKIIILVDDVLYTGRSARAAMDALIDLGRPRAIRLAVLVDRAGRELPIQADYSGYKTDIAPGKLVQVSLVESEEEPEA